MLSVDSSIYLIMIFLEDKYKGHNILSNCAIVNNVIVNIPVLSGIRTRNYCRIGLDENSHSNYW